MATISPDTLGTESVTDGVPIPGVVPSTGGDAASTPPVIAYWEPIAASACVSLLIGLPGLGILVFGTSLPRKNKLLNVFN